MRVILIILLASISIGSASQTNLEAISSSIDSLTKQSLSKIYNNKIKIQTEYSELVDRIESSFKSLDSNYIITTHSKYGTLFSLDTIKIEYNYVNSTRTIRLVANIQTLADDNIVDYSIPYIFTDSIDIDNISRIEDESFPFTKGKLIKESSFGDDALEPAIFVGSAVIIIYLLFTVRSS